MHEEKRAQAKAKCSSEKKKIYILWLASMIVNNNTDTAPNKNIALFVVCVVAVAADPTIIILLLPSHRIDCIPLSTDVPLYMCVFVGIMVPRPTPEN